MSKVKYYPNFFCAGTQKAATSTLADMLRLHPDVFVPAIKELNFFATAKYDHIGVSYLDDIYKGKDSYPVRGDFSPGSMYIDEAASRIIDTCGSDVKVLCILRNPIDRAISAWSMFCQRGDETLSLEEAFEYEQQYKGTRHACGQTYEGYFDRGLYVRQIKNMLNTFKHVQVILFEDFIRNNQEVMNDIYDFLEIERMDIPLLKSNSRNTIKNKSLRKIYNVLAKKLGKSDLRNSRWFIYIKDFILKKVKKDTSSTNSEISPEFRNVLKNYYKDDIVKLEKLINQDLTEWKA